MGRGNQSLNTLHEKKIYLNLLFKMTSSSGLQVNINFYLYSGAWILGHKDVTENCHSLELFSLYETQDAPLHSRHISKRNGPTYRNVFPGYGLSYKCLYSSPFYICYVFMLILSGYLLTGGLGDSITQNACAVLPCKSTKDFVLCWYPINIITKKVLIVWNSWWKATLESS